MWLTEKTVETHVRTIPMKLDLQAGRDHEKRKQTRAQASPGADDGRGSERVQQLSRIDTMQEPQERSYGYPQ